MPESITTRYCNTRREKIQILFINLCFLLTANTESKYNRALREQTLSRSGGPAFFSKRAAWDRLTPFVNKDEYKEDFYDSII